MKKIIIAVVACVGVTSGVLAYGIIAFTAGDEPAPTPKLTVDEEAAQVTGCPVEIAILCLLAEKGQTDSQHNLAVAYNDGSGVEKNRLKAQMWWSIAAMNGHEQARAQRDALRRKMSAADIAEADRRAWRWMAEHPKPGAAEE